MEDRISIPTSEDGSPERRRQNRRNAGAFGIVAAIAVLVVIVGVVVSTEAQDQDSGPTELSAPNAEGLPAADLRGVSFPGVGAVNAVTSLGDDLAAIVAGTWGSTIWRLDATDGVWRIAEVFPGITLVDGVAFDGGLLVAGFERLGAVSLVLAGEPGSMVELDYELEDQFAPNRIRAGTDSAFVFTSVSAVASTFLGGPALQVSQGVVTVLDPGARGAGIDDVVEVSGRLLAVGSDQGQPAMWEILASGELQAQALDLDLGSGRIAAAAVTTSGVLIGLMVGRLGNPLDSTAVVELEAPFTILDVPTAGVWDDLIVLSEGLVALPAGGSEMYRTTNGRDWTLERVRLPDANQDTSLRLEDVYVTASGAEIFAGASGPSDRTPYLASASAISAEFEIPDGGWSLLEPSIEVATVHFGRIQVGIDGGVVVVRRGFGEEWTQPVFADVSSVGGLVEVFELSFGYVLTADRPFGGLWFSQDGGAWQLIENGLLRVAAGPGDEALIVAEGEMSRLTADAVVPVETEEEFVSFLGGAFDWVDGLGYVIQRPDGTLRNSADGSVWTDVDFEIEVVSAIVAGGRLAVRDVDGWHLFDPAFGELRPLTVPNGAFIDSLAVVRRNVVLVRARSRLWLSNDLENWIEASLGIWNGSDGVLTDAWITDLAVVGVLGGPDESRLYRLER